jgi:hypothetical protein
MLPSSVALNAFSSSETLEDFRVSASSIFAACEVAMALLITFGQM